METDILHVGDCLDVMDDLPENSVHAVVTDPPYGLAFMGESWDDFQPREYQGWVEEWATAARRVLKPGGHLIAFSGDKTHHRLFSGVEDAGYEIRHTLNWLYGNGMPKGARVSRWMDDEDAEAWEGFRTELKPAAEYAVLARAPFDGPAYENVLEHGTAALNVDGTRIPLRDDGGDGNWSGKTEDGERKKNVYGEWSDQRGEEPEGRFPPNVLLDPRAAETLDEQAGDLGLSRGVRGRNTAAGEIYDDYGDEGVGETIGYGDRGGPSRFYYCSKASTSERTMNGKVENEHPTVKPLDLMEWLITLVTAEGQTVLDPFAGSGTTGLAALSTGREYILIERDGDYAEVARERIVNSEEILQQTLDA